MKVQITGFVTYKKPDEWEKDFHGFEFFGFNPTQFEGSKRVVVRPYSFEVEVPEDFDPRPDLVKALEKKKEKAQADFAETVMRIDRQINELLALEHTA